MSVTQSQIDNATYIKLNDLLDKLRQQLHDQGGSRLLTGQEPEYLDIYATKAAYNVAINAIAKRMHDLEAGDTLEFPPRVI